MRDPGGGEEAPLHTMQGVEVRDTNDKRVHDDDWAVLFSAVPQKCRQ